MLTSVRDSLPKLQFGYTASGVRSTLVEREMVNILWEGADVAASTNLEGHCACASHFVQI
jgi:hypothetical protein